MTLEVIDRDIRLHGNLLAEKRDKLMEIADKCPVHRTLTGKLEIRTKMTEWALNSVQRVVNISLNKTAPQ